MIETVNKQDLFEAFHKALIELAGDDDQTINLLIDVVELTKEKLAESENPTKSLSLNEYRKQRNN